MMALYKRERTGEGMNVSTSLLESQIFMNWTSRPRAG